MRIEVKVFGEKNISWQVQPEAMQAVDLNNNKTYVKNIFFDKKILWDPDFYEKYLSSILL